MHCAVCKWNPDEFYEGLKPDDKLRKLLEHIKYQTSGKINDSKHLKALDEEVSIMLLIEKD